MAKKRKIKRRKGSRLRNPDSQTSTMSSEDSYALQSGRQSSEMMSDHVMSEGVNTAMTSIMDTDEDLTDALEVDEEDDMISIYPASHYPGAPSIYRPAMSYVPEHSMAGDSDVAASTRSLWEQDLDYRDIHGRRYCREYFMPNDEMEQIRLTLNHQIFIHLLNDELTLAPLQNPTHILDVGTGTGEWAIRMAELWPQTEVVGTDIAAIAETRSVPMNVFFEIEDAEEWDRTPELYDLIHLRCMEGAFKNWRFIYDSIFYSLKPGGWIELQDFDSAEGFTQFVSSFPEGSLMSDLNNDLVTAATKCGRPRGTFFLEPRLFEEAGFVDIRVTEYVIPITVAEKSVGKIWLISCLDALEAYCLRLLTTYMGWDPEKCKAACEATARDMARMAKNPEASKGLQVKMRVVVARKPLDAPPAEYPPALDGYATAPSMESFADKRTLVDPVVTVHQGNKDDMPNAAQIKDNHGLSIPSEDSSVAGGV